MGERLKLVTEAEKQIRDAVRKLTVIETVYLLEAFKHMLLRDGINYMSQKLEAQKKNRKSE